MNTPEPGDPAVEPWWPPRTWDTTLDTSPPLPRFDAPVLPASPSAVGPDGPLADDPDATPVRVHDEERFVAPAVVGTSTEAPRRALRLPLLVAGAAIVVAVALVVAAVLNRPRTDPRILQTSSAAPIAQADKPHDVVKSYFQALQTGSAADVLAWGDPGPGSRALLTDEALQAARAQLPLTDVVVSPASDSATSVDVEYKAGGKKVTTQVPVIKRGTTWRLGQATVSVAINAKRSEKVPLLINGVRTDAPIAEVFPGGYSVTTGLPFIAYDAAANFTAATLDAKPTIGQLTTQITPEGTAALERASRASLNACLARTELAPANCPFAVESSQPVVPASIKRSLDNDPFSGFTPRLEPSSSTATAVVEVKTTVNATTTSGSTISDPKVNAATLRADLSSLTDSTLQVNWAR